MAQFSLYFLNESPKTNIMKTKISISLLSFLLSTFMSYGQDSIRTRNDKPGTPQSLRTTNNAPKNRIHVVEAYKPPGQTIYHGATESNKINNTKKRARVSPNITKAKEIPRTPAITIDNQTTQQAIQNDSAVNKGTMGNGQSNATNPIRK